MGHLRVVSLGAGARIESLLVHSHSVDGGKADWPFAIYYAEPTTSTPEHQALIKQITHIAGIAIERATSKVLVEETPRQLGPLLSELLRVGEVILECRGQVSQRSHCHVRCDAPRIINLFRGSLNPGRRKSRRACSDDIPRIA
jgi:hypothetical protein